MKKYLYATITIVILAALAGYFALKKSNLPVTPQKTPAGYTDELAACGAYPNGSTQTVMETSRLSIKIPKGLYPNQNGFLSFATASGTATAGWISNAGLIGASYGATANCWAYYYEFDGRGEVDLAATSTVAAVPDYSVRFIVTANPADASSTVEYRNDQYGFTFALPEDWQGYTVVRTAWTGYTACPTGDCTAATGTELIIRNPNWTAAKPRQDIPVMVFTPTEWNAVASGTLIVSAAPIPPTKLDKNSRYVFALPARYNFAFPEGWQEVETILQNHPLRAF